MNLASDATKSVFFLFSWNFTTLIIKSTSCSNHPSLVFFHWDDLQRLLGGVSLSHGHQVCSVDRIAHDCKWLIQDSETVERRTEEVEMKRKEREGEGFARGREKTANMRRGE